MRKLKESKKLIRALIGTHKPKLLTNIDDYVCQETDNKYMLAFLRTWKAKIVVLEPEEETEEEIVKKEKMLVLTPETINLVLQNQHTHKTKFKHFINSLKMHKLFGIEYTIGILPKGITLQDIHTDLRDLVEFVWQIKTPNSEPRWVGTFEDVDWFNQVLNRLNLSR